MKPRQATTALLGAAHGGHASNDAGVKQTIFDQVRYGARHSFEADGRLIIIVSRHPVCHGLSRQ